MRYLVFVILFLAACGSTQTEDARMIDEPGVYHFPEHNMNVTVTETGSVISVDVTDTLGRVKTNDTFPDFTALDEWAVYVDSAANVWVQSADIGTYTLANNNGVYTVAAFVVAKQNQRLLPGALKARVPGTLNNKLNR